MTIKWGRHTQRVRHSASMSERVLLYVFRRTNGGDDLVLDHVRSYATVSPKTQQLLDKLKEWVVVTTQILQDDDLLADACEEADDFDAQSAIFDCVERVINIILLNS